MRIDPELRAWRADPAASQAAQTALEHVRMAWLASPEVGWLKGELAAYGAGRALSATPHLAQALAEVAAAKRLIGPLFDTMVAGLRQHPLGLAPFRHQSNEALSILELARTKGAMLAVLAYHPVTRAEAASVTFAAGERHELCIAGKGQGEALSLTGESGPGRARITRTTIGLTPGWRASFDNPTATKVITAVDQPLVVLRLTREADTPSPAREYRLADGALVHEAAADRRDSRRELALTVLGSMGWRDALPVMLDAAMAGPAHVRWEAVRQSLAMDSLAGFAALCRIAADPLDPLAAPAAALRAQLLEAHPQLTAATGKQPCLA